MKAATLIILVIALLSEAFLPALAQRGPTPAEPDRAPLLPDAEPELLPDEPSVPGEKPPTFLGTDWRQNATDREVEARQGSPRQRCRDKPGADDGTPPTVCVQSLPPRVSDK